jgi:fructan beta-fructosidase
LTYRPDDVHHRARGVIDDTDRRRHPFLGAVDYGAEKALPGEPVDSLTSPRQNAAPTATGVTGENISRPLTGPAAKGGALDVGATLRLEDAERFGPRACTGANGEETVIGYDTTTQELYVDRPNSGAVDFSSDFPGVRRAPPKAENGRAELRVLVGRSSSRSSAAAAKP